MVCSYEGTTLQNGRTLERWRSQRTLRNSVYVQTRLSKSGLELDESRRESPLESWASKLLDRCLAATALWNTGRGGSIDPPHGGQAATQAYSTSCPCWGSALPPATGPAASVGAQLSLGPSQLSCWPCPRFAGGGREPRHLCKVTRPPLGRRNAGLGSGCLDSWEKHPPCQPRFWLHLLCSSDWGAVCPVPCCRATVPDRASPKLSAEPANRPPAASSPERPWPPQGPGDGAPDSLKVSPQIPSSLPEQDATWAHPSCPSTPRAGD